MKSNYIEVTKEKYWEFINEYENTKGIETQPNCVTICEPVKHCLNDLTRKGDIGLPYTVGFYEDNWLEKPEKRHYFINKPNDKVSNA